MVFVSTRAKERERLRQIQGAVKAAESLLEKKQCVNDKLAKGYISFAIKTLVEVEASLEGE